MKTLQQYINEDFKISRNTIVPKLTKVVALYRPDLNEQNTRLKSFIKNLFFGSNHVTLIWCRIEDRNKIQRNLGYNYSFSGCSLFKGGKGLKKLSDIEEIIGEHEWKNIGKYIFKQDNAQVFSEYYGYATTFTEEDIEKLYKHKNFDTSYCCTYRNDNVEENIRNLIQEGYLDDIDNENDN